MTKAFVRRVRQRALVPQLLVPLWGKYAGGGSLVSEGQVLSSLLSPDQITAQKAKLFTPYLFSDAHETTKK